MPSREIQIAATRRTSIGSRRNPEAATAILDAARAILLEDGYPGFSIEAVARRAGAGKPTIYRWWPTKADLFIAIYGPEKDAAVQPGLTGDTLEDLVHYTRELWRFWREHPAGRAFRGLIAEAQAGGPALEALRDRFLPTRLEPVRQIFGAAAERSGAALADVEARVALWVGFSWYALLTDRIDDEPVQIRTAMAVLAA